MKGAGAGNPAGDVMKFAVEKASCTKEEQNRPICWEC